MTNGKVSITGRPIFSRRALEPTSLGHSRTPTLPHRSRDLRLIGVEDLLG
jgi:hypothetical protein